MAYIFRLLYLVFSASCFISCSDNVEPLKSVMQFSTGEGYIKESNGNLTSFHPMLRNEGVGVEYNVKILLDRPVSETTVVRFSTIGPAVRGSENGEVSDFEIEPYDNLLTLNKGDSSGSLLLRVFEDYELEYTEINNIAYLVEGFTIVLEEVVSGSATLGKKSAFSIFILEDDPIISLSWDPLDYPGVAPGDTDMDLFLWRDGELIASSARTGGSFEIITFPAGFPDGQYGFSYTYYDGSSDDLEFYVDIFNPGGRIDKFQNRKLFTERYTSENKNKYDVTGVAPYISQTMDKIGLDYFNLSGIAIPASGSRGYKNDGWIKARHTQPLGRCLDSDFARKVKEFSTLEIR